MNVVDVYLSKWSRKSDTYRTMRSALDTIARILDGKTVDTYPWETLRYETLRSIPAQLAEAGLSVATINKSLSALRGVLEAAWRAGKILDDDYRRIEIKNVRGKALAAGRALSPDDLERMIQAIATTSPRDAALLAVLYACGLRRSEAVALRREDYDFDAKRLIAYGKGRKRRAIPVAPEWQPILERWWETRPPRSPLFVSQRNRALSRRGVSDIIDRFCAASGVRRFTPHDLRRSFATHILTSGGDIAVVQRLMGHASLNTTTIYDRRGDEVEAATVALLGRKP